MTSKVENGCPIKAKTCFNLISFAEVVNYLLVWSLATSTKLNTYILIMEAKISGA